MLIIIIIVTIMKISTFDATVDYLTNKESLPLVNKGNNKITELRTIFQRESQNS